jgi:predicted lipid-binding transport protein (Tim44 family)
MSERTDRTAPARSDVPSAADRGDAVGPTPDPGTGSPGSGPTLPAARGEEGRPTPSTGAPRPDAPAGAPGLAGTLALYGLARLGLLAVVAGLLLLAGTPLMIALLVALIVALPLSMLLFRGLRARLDEALAIARAQRGAQREALRAGLRGDPDPVRDPGSGDRHQGQPDAGGG